MTEFEPERISALNEYTPEFAEDLRPRLRQHEVFDTAFDIVNNLSSERVSADDVYDYWVERKNLTEDLNSTVRKSKLFGKVAILEGTGLIIPSVNVTIEDDRTVVKRAGADETVKRSLQSTLTPDAFKGPFEGFSMTFREITEIGSDEGLYVPTVSYQVKAATYRTPNTVTNTYATGTVGITKFTFEDDKKLDEYRGLLEALYSLVPDYSIAVSEITMALSGNTITAFDLKRVAYFTMLITNSIKDPAMKLGVEDLLTDIIKQKLGNSSNYTIKTARYNRSDSTMNENFKNLYTSQANPFVLTQEIKDVVYEDELEYSADGVRPSGTRSMHVIVSAGNRSDYNYIALRNIIEITKS